MRTFPTTSPLHRHTHWIPPTLMFVAKGIKQISSPGTKTSLKSFRQYFYKKLAYFSNHVLIFPTAANPRRKPNVRSLTWDVSQTFADVWSNDPLASISTDSLIITLPQYSNCPLSSASRQVFSNLSSRFLWLRFWSSPERIQMKAGSIFPVDRILDRILEVLAVELKLFIVFVYSSAATTTTTGWPTSRLTWPDLSAKYQKEKEEKEREYRLLFHTGVSWKFVMFQNFMTILFWVDALIKKYYQCHFHILFTCFLILKLFWTSVLDN